MNDIYTEDFADIMQCSKERKQVLEILVEGGKWKDGDSLLLQEICLVSYLEIRAGAGEATVKVAPARGKRCARCWKHEESVGRESEHPELCERCAGVVKGITA